MNWYRKILIKIAHNLIYYDIGHHLLNKNTRINPKLDDNNPPKQEFIYVIWPNNLLNINEVIDPKQTHVTDFQLRTPEGNDENFFAKGRVDIYDSIRASVMFSTPYHKKFTMFPDLQQKALKRVRDILENKFKQPVELYLF